MVNSNKGLGNFLALAAGLGINYGNEMCIKDTTISDGFPKRKLRKHFGILEVNINVVKNKNQKCSGCGHKNKKCTCKKG